MASDPTTPHVPRGRIILFVSVFSSALLAANWFVGATWNHFWGVRNQLVLPLALSALALIFVATTILSRRFSNSGIRLVYRVTAVWIGLLNYFLVASLLSIPVKSKVVIGSLFAAAGISSIYGFLNAFWLRVSRVTVALPNLPAHWRGRSIALVTDMHLGNVRGAGLTRRVVAKLKVLQPEAVFISGDMFDGTKADLDAMLEPWKNASAPAGIYYVTGNHEEFTDRVKYIDAVARAGIRALNNEKVEINGLQIVGVHDGEQHERDIFRAILRGVQLDRNRASILIAHEPLNLGISEGEGISLHVCGHTHGGQFWPWTFVAGRVHGPFNHGLNRIGKMLVLTSYGVGTWGAPMRVGTKSEIVLIRLEAAEI